MDTNNLEQLLQQVLAEFGRATKIAADAIADFPYPSPPFFNEDGHVLSYPIIDHITTELGKFSGFASLHNVHVRDGGSGSHQIPLPFFAASLAARALETNNPAQVMADFIKLIETNDAEGWLIAVLTGLRVDKPTRLQQDVMLIPFDQLPSTKHKKMLLSDAENRRIIGGSIPSAALILSFRVTELFVKSERAPSPLPGSDERVYRLRDIADCIMIACDSATGIMAEWPQIREPAAPRLHEIAMVMNPKVVLSTPVGIDDTFKFERVGHILDGYEAFAGDLDSLRLATSRLRQARRTTLSTEDQAIELGIAIEVLLTHGSRMQQEITYRLSTRGAWLLGESADDRLAIADLIRVLYALRSDVVHSGRIEHNKKLGGRRVSAFDLVSQGSDLVSRIITSILTRGEWPRWDRIVLGR